VSAAEIEDKSKTEHERKTTYSSVVLKYFCLEKIDKNDVSLRKKQLEENEIVNQIDVEP